MLRQLRPLREVADVAERSASPALLDERLRFVLADAVDVFDADPNRAVFDHALRRTHVHIRRTGFDAAALSVADERRGRIETHRLSVQKRAQKLRRIVMS